MKSIKYIIPFLCFVILFIYWKEKNHLYVDFFPYYSTYTSKSRSESVADGSYVCAYFPLKSKFSLHNHNATIKLDTAWVQYSWHEKSLCLIFVKKEKENSLIIIFPFKNSEPNTFLFTLKSILGNKQEKYSNGISEDRYENHYYFIEDTIRLKVNEKSPVDTIGWKEQIDGDTLIFVRTKQ